MIAFRRQKKGWATPRLVSFRGLIQNFRQASPPLSYAESPPPRDLVLVVRKSMATKVNRDCRICVHLDLNKLPYDFKPSLYLVTSNAVPVTSIVTMCPLLSK